jgi:hypothetical protein
MSGKAGDIVFTISRDGKAGFRMAAMFSKEKFKRAANYLLCRKNNDEFTGSARAAHSLRMCLGETVRRYADSELTSRMVAMCRDVISLGPGFGGKRTFEVAPHTHLLRRVELDERESLSGRFMAPFTVTVNTDRNTATLDVPSFNTDSYLTRPQGATHFKLLLVAGVLSDHEWVGGNEVYAPVDADVNGVSKVEVSAIAPAFNAVNAALQMVVAIPGAPVLAATSCLVVSVGIEFYRVINTYEELMAQGNAMRVVGVY